MKLYLSVLVSDPLLHEYLMALQISVCFRIGKYTKHTSTIKYCFLPYQLTA